MSSFSSISQMQSCGTKHVLTRMFRGSMPRGEALTFGSAYHEAIENGLDEGIKMLKENGLDNKIELLEEMIDRLAKYMEEEELEITDNEVEFGLEVPGTEEKFIGYVDAIGKLHGEDVLIEFKTAATIDVSTIHINAQITAYLYAVRELGISDATKMLYIINRKRKDKEPRILKNGRLSTAKGQGCSPQAYYDKAIEIYGTQAEFPTKVQECLDNIIETYEPNLVGVVTSRTEAELNRFGEMLKKEVKREGDIKKLIKEGRIYEALEKNPCMPSAFKCKNCEVVDACVAITKRSVSEEDINEDWFQEVNNDN